MTPSVEHERSVDPKASPRAWWTLALLSTAYVLSFIDRQILSIMVGPIQAELGISDIQIGLLQGIAFALFYATLGVPIAKLADTGNRRNLISAGLVLWSAATAAAGLVRGYPMFLLMRMGVGVGEATLGPAAYSMFADLFDKRRLARVIGVFHSASGASIGLSVMIGGALMHFFEGWQARPAFLGEMSAWRLTLISVGLPGIVLALLIMTVVREPSRLRADVATSSSDQANFGAIIRTVLSLNRGVFWKIILASALMCIYGFGSLAWFPTFLARAHHFDPARIASTLGSVLMVAGLAGPLLGGFAADWLQRHVGLAVLKMLAIFAALSVVPAIFAPFIASPVLALMLFGVGFACFAATMPLVPTAIQMMAPGDMRARISAIWLCVSNVIGLGLGPLLVATMTQLGFETPQSVGKSLAIVGGVASALAAAMLIAVAKTTQSEDPERIAGPAWAWRGRAQVDGES